MKSRKKVIIFLILSSIIIFIFKTKTYIDYVAQRNANCSKKTIDEIINFGRKYKFQNGIAKIIHYTYKDVYVPSQYIELVMECQRVNKDALFVFWSDSVALEFIERYHANYVNIYRTYLQPNVHILKKSDLIRYFVIATLGGVYMDLDTQCQSPLSTVMLQNNCILSREVEVASRILWHQNYVAMNSFMACTAGHRFFQFILTQLRPRSYKYVLFETGPMFLTKTVEKYNEERSLSDKDDKVFVASSDTFSPFVERYLDDKCRSPSEQWLMVSCGSLRDYRAVERQKMKEAVVVHLFLHLGYEWGKDRIKDNENICYKVSIWFPLLE